ncbi:hypothetical protein R1flu_024426 [Riccia fluitans]|uniref:Uncharacterized protein n=1 Tax=Riccia fluitans TaxID=41844 RepID=A0ABD1XVC0_9MARC
MFSLFGESSKDLDSEGTDRRPPLQGTDIKAMEKILKPGLKPSIRKLVHEDDYEGLEEALEAERSANPKPPVKKNKKKGGGGGNVSKEDDDFAILGRRVLHYACGLDAVECCKLLITSQTFPRIWVDAVDEADQRSALHVASQNHSRRCIEILLKQGANVALKNKQQAVPLEEALTSSKLHVDWDFLTPAAQIVEKVREKDLVALRALEAKCKDLLVPIAFKLAKGLKLVPLVALLIVARGTFVVNSVAKKVEGEDESVGTLVDLLLGKALAYSSVAPLDKSSSKCKKSFSDGLGETWSGETSRLLRKGSCEAEGSGGDAKHRRNSADWESLGESKHRHDLEETCSEIKHRKDLSEWEEITSKYRSNGTEGEGSVSDSKFRRTSSGDMDKTGGKHVEDKCSAGGEDLETNCRIARKLLECVLLFGPRLSAHPQSPSLPPLLRAAQANDDVLLSLLLEAGAPINETDSDGNTALHWALRQATPVNKRSVNSKLVKRLLDASANVLLGNKLGATPVHTAAGHGHFEALSLILEKEAGGVNVMAATKETPLHYSVKNNHLLCTAILLTHGANRNVSSLRSQKPYQLAPSPEMRALLSMDEATLREQSWDSLFQMLALAAQQQALLPMCTDNGPTGLPLSFSQAAAQQPPMSQIRSQFHCPPVMPHASGLHPLSFSQSLSMPSIQELHGQGSSQAKSFQQQQPALRHHMSLPSPHESNPAWNSSCLALQKLGHKQVLNGTELSLLGDGDLTNGKSNVNLPAYKTVLCRFFGTSEGCGWGNKCHFAHSEEELLAGQQKLKIAGEKIEGTLSSKTVQICPDLGEQGVKNFKTKLCMHHEKMGTCPHGGKCKFAHGEAELRPLSSLSSITPTLLKSGPRPSTSSSLTSSGSEDDDTSIRKVFVGGLPHFIHSDELWEFFESEFGKVVDAVVICGNDEEGKPRSRGFGFVLFAEQKDADEAVRKHYFPFRGKKVEVKRAQARLDSPSGDEAGKMTSCFSSGISSPAAPQSPALPSTMPGVNLFNDGMQLPSSTGIGGQPVWSLPSLSVDTPQEGVPASLFPQNRGQIVSQSSLPFSSEHNRQPVHVNGALSGSPNGGFLPSQDSGQFYQNNQPYPSGREVHHNPSQPIARSTRPQVETNSLVSKAYNDPSPLLGYSSSPVKTTVSPALSSYSNGNVSHNSTSQHPFSYYVVDDNSQSFFSTAPPTPSQTSDTNQGAEDEELTQLLELLKTPSTSNHSSSQARIPTTVSSISSSNISNRGGNQAFTAQNVGKEAASMYSRESFSHLSYTGASQAMNNYSGGAAQLPEGFREFPQSSTKYKEVGQTSNGVGYTSTLPSSLGYGSQLPAGSKVAADSSSDLAAYRAGMGPVGGPPSNVMSVLLPGFSNPQQGLHLYDSNHSGHV